MGILDIAISTLAIFLLLQQPWLAQSIDFGPTFPPFLGNLVCDVVPCGKGSCKTTTNATLPGYECECEPGWSRAGLEYMPCVIPNCTFDFSCSKAPGRGSQGLLPIDPCFYADCGGGKCTNGAFPYRCECDEGYRNLLNSTLFSCVKDCALGVDCNHLQIPLQNNTVTPNNTNTNSNGGMTLSSGNLMLLLIFGISMSAMVSWR